MENVRGLALGRSLANCREEPVGLVWAFLCCSGDAFVWRKGTVVFSSFPQRFIAGIEDGVSWSKVSHQLMCAFILTIHIFCHVTESKC
jgi:hypothetical protein